SAHAAFSASVIFTYGSPSGRVRFGAFRFLNRPAFFSTAPETSAFACGSRGRAIDPHNIIHKLSTGYSKRRCPTLVRAYVNSSPQWWTRKMRRSEERRVG